MEILKKNIKNLLITAGIMLLSFLISYFLQDYFSIDEHSTTVFVFAVFLISLLTDGYFFGILSACLSVLIVNFAFTYPFLAFNFMQADNIISAIVMIIIAILTGALTTKLKRHEEEKLEGERERMRANLLRAVSHDLRTPLTTIYASASTLMENRNTLNSEQISSILQGIREDSEWLLHMVENLLSITKINQGEVKIIKTPTVLEELIDSVLIKFHKRYPDQEVLLQMPENLIVIPMDAILIEQVLINLLENAVLHAVGMKHLYLNILQKNDTVVFEVQDDGAGIETNRLKYLFRGYIPPEEIPSDSQKSNAGIGLSVCATIVQAHGGTISAQNIPQGGSVFRFTLALEEEFELDEQ